MKISFLKNDRFNLNLNFIFLFIFTYFLSFSFFTCFAKCSSVATNDISKVQNSSDLDNFNKVVQIDKKKIEFSSAKDLNKFLVNIPEPSENKDVIILDAGHGYCDSGGGYNGYYEYIPNAQLIYKLANSLVNTGFFEVYLTHPLNYAGEDLVFDVKKNSNHAFVHIMLPEIKPDSGKKLIVGKQNYSKKYGVNLLQALMRKVVDSLRKSRSKIYSLCLHHNVGSKKDVKIDNDVVAGMRIFYNSNKKNQNGYSKKSVLFCNDILNLCKNIYGKPNVANPISESAFAVTIIGCPAVLCEVDFIDNLKRQSIISNDRSQNRMVRALKNAIMKTYGYKIKWANVNWIKNNETGEVKIIVKNLQNVENFDNLKMAVYGAFCEKDGSPIWFDCKKDGENWACNFNFKNVEKGKIYVDLYTKLNDKLTVVDSDFDEFEV